MSRQEHNQHDAELGRLRSRVAELESDRESKKKDQFRDIVLTLAFTAAPFGFGIPILYSCISWVVAWVAFVHLCLNLEHLSRVSNWIKSVGTVIASLALVLCFYSPIRTAYIKERARAISGDLVARPDGLDHSKDLPAIQLGPNGQRIAWTEGATPQIEAFYDKISVKLVNQRVQLSTTVHDDNKNLIVETIDNHWTVSSSTAVCWDKNYTDDSLEVRDGHGRVVLQVKLFPTVVQIQEEWQWNPGTKSGGIFQDGNYDEKNGIKKMFRYPSNLYWGQLEPNTH